MIINARVMSSGCVVLAVHAGAHRTSTTMTTIVLALQLIANTETDEAED